MNYLIIITSILIMAFTIIISTLHSCNPLGSNTGSTYSLTGRMLKDCSGEPYKNYSLTFYIPANLGQNKIELGTVNTDENGYFKLSNIPSNRNANINIKHTIDANYVTTWGEFMVPGSANIYEDGAIYDLGDYYGEYNTNTLTSIIWNSYSLNDTLFIGYDLDHYQIFITDSTQVIYQDNSNGSHYRSSDIKANSRVYWGIGKAFWDSLYISNSGINLDNYTIIAKQSVCTYPDTTYYSIP